MSKKRGMLLDPSTNDLLVVNRSLQVGDVTVQNQFMILSAHVGEIKQQPVQGVGISDIVLDDDTGTWARDIRIQLERDEMVVRSSKIDRNLNISIDASYR